MYIYIYIYIYMYIYRYILRPEPLIPKPYTLKLGPDIMDRASVERKHPFLNILNPKPQTRNKPQTPNSKPQIMHPKP